MPLASLGLVILAAFIHATWNLLAKRAAGAGAMFVPAYTSVALVAYAPWAIWLISRGTLRWTPAILLCLLASGLIHLAYSLCLQRGYRVADLSVVYPVARGTGPMLASVGAFALLGEMPTPRGLVGLVTVVAGISLIATNGRIDAFERPEAKRGVRWGIGTGSLIASYTVVDAYGVKALLVPPVILDWCANAVRLALLMPLVLTDRGRARAAMRGYWGLAIAVGLLSPLSYILVLGALSLGAPLRVVAPAREMSMMIGALFGMVILKEPVGVGRLAGCGLLIVGVILL